MRTALLILALSLLAGCDASAVTLPGPTVYLVVGEAFSARPISGPTLWTEADLMWIEMAGRAWRELGFDVRPLGEPIDGSLDAGSVKVIQIFRDAGLEQNRVAGLSDRSTGVTYINAGFTGFDLRATVMHELGHHLLDTSEHVAPELYPAVMVSGTRQWSFTQPDYDFACRVAGRCRRY